MRTTYGPIPEVRAAWAALAVSLVFPVLTVLTIAGLLAGFLSCVGNPEPENGPLEPPRPAAPAPSPR